jgi:geranylgeranyl reductase family protein
MRSRSILSHERATRTADVVIVGAGPSGCAAAYDLALKGFRVLLLDRTQFPRKKPCAGGLTVKTIRALRYSITPVIQRTVSQLAVSCRMRHPRLLESMDPICHMVERSAFDLFCLKQTLAAGARLAVVKRIDEIEESPRTVSLATNDGLIRAQFLIGADGVHSRVRRLTGRFERFHAGFAVEGRVDRVPANDLNMGFDFSWVAGGYGWVFPKAGHINVGLYTSRPDVGITRQHLVDYAVRRLGRPSPTHIAGSPLGMGGWKYRPGRGRVLLVGDAAGLVDPLLGEGLYHAIISGQEAAAVIAGAVANGADACKTYAERLMPIQRELLFAERAAAVFYRLPMTGQLLLTSPLARIPLMMGFSRGMPLRDIFLHGHRLCFGMPVSDRRIKK